MNTALQRALCMLPNTSETLHNHTDFLSLKNGSQKLQSMILDHHHQTVILSLKNHTGSALVTFLSELGSEHLVLKIPALNFVFLLFYV